MSLRLKLNLILAALMAAFAVLLAAWQIEATRHSVREEVMAANRVATQILARIGARPRGAQELAQLLPVLGRVRANEIVLVDDAGRELYRSPPSPYKAGRDAPDWYASLVSPPLQLQMLAVDGGTLSIRPDPTRATLDGWDDLSRFLLLAAGAFAVLHGFAFAMVGRALRGWPAIADALGRLQAGDLSTRLPPLPGREARLLADAFNRMAEAMAEGAAARARAQRAEARLSDSRELAEILGRQLDEERRAIARELHDELGQSVTAIRSLALGIAQQPRIEPRTADAARIIEAEAARLYDAMHGVIPRLAPLSLDDLGLAEALADLVDRQRAHHPQVRITLDTASLPPAIGGTAALTLYRCAQEALTNALRHAHASAIHLRAARSGDTLRLEVSDDGRGLDPAASEAGRFGLRGLRERLEALGGSLAVGPAGERGVRVRATLPWTRPDPDEPDPLQPEPGSHEPAQPGREEPEPLQPERGGREPVQPVQPGVEAPEPLQPGGQQAEAEPAPRAPATPLAEGARS